MLELNQKAIAKFDSDLYGSLNIWRDEQGREYYKALDVCSALKLQNVSQSLSRYVDKDYIQQFDDGSHRGGKTNYLSEPGLYQLIFASKTEWAKQFQRWVFEEVLPKLRASGGYIMPNATSEQLEALQAEITDIKIKRNAMFSPLGGYNLDSWWNLMMVHKLVYLKDSNGYRSVYNKLKSQLSHIDAKQPELIVTQWVGRHSRGNFENCLVLKSSTWLKLTEYAGVSRKDYPEFFALFE